MINEDNKYEWMTAYAAHELSEKDLNVFEEKMDKEADFREEVEMFLVLRAEHNLEQKTHFRHLIEQENLQQTVKKIEAKVVEMPPPVKETSSRKSWLSAAAVLLIGAIAAVLYFNVPTGGNNENPLAVSQEYLQEYYESPVVSRGANAFDENWENAIESYNQKNFQEVHKQLQPIFDAGKGRDKHYFYDGLSYLYQKPSDPQKAIVSFKEVWDTYYAESTVWYMSLAYIQLEKYGVARKLLERLKQENNPKRQADIQRLLDALEGKK